MLRLFVYCTHKHTLVLQLSLVHNEQVKCVEHVSVMACSE